MAHSSRLPFVVVLCLLLLAAAGRAPARESIVSLTAPNAPVPAGGAVPLDLVVANLGSTALTYRLPDALDGQLSGGGKTWAVTLRGAGDLNVPPNGFARRILDLSLPADAAGQLVLELNEPGLPRTVIDVTAPPAASAAPRPAVTPAESDTGKNGEKAEILGISRFKRGYLDHFAAHEPMYFIAGGQRPAAKFQFSFKYRVLNDTGPLARYVPALRGLRIAYSQRSLWDIRANSSPFYDSSYMPELMYESLAADNGKHSGFTWLGYQVAVQHESNGRAGESSRSLNTIYFRPLMVFGDPEGWRMILVPKFFAYLGDLNDNPTLKTYRGYSELRAAFGRANRLSVSVTGRVGDRFRKGSLQIDASYPTEFLTGNFAVYLLLQHWTGYGESLLSYDRRSSATRAGFSLTR